MSQNVFITIGGVKKLVGTLKGNCFYKIVTKQNHIYYTTNSVGIDEEVWREVVKKCEYFYVFFKSRDEMYKARVSTLDLVKDYRNHKPHRTQVLFKLKHFVKQVRKS